MRRLMSGLLLVLGVWLASGREAIAQLTLGFTLADTADIWVQDVISIDVLSADDTRVTVRATNGATFIVDFWTPAPQTGWLYLPGRMSAASAQEMLMLVRSFRADRDLYWTLQFRKLWHWSWAGNFYDMIYDSETYLEVYEPVYLTATYAFQGGMNNVRVRGSGGDYGELEIMRAKSRNGVLYHEVAYLRFLRTAKVIDGATYQPLTHNQVMSLLGTLLMRRPWIIFDNVKGDYDGYRVVHAASTWSR